MTRDDDFIGQLEGYLDAFEGSTPFPDAIRDAVRAELPMTKQLGPFSGPMRYPSMTNKSVRIALAAAAVLVVALIGIQLFRGTNVGGPGASPSQSAAPSLAPTPTASPVPALFLSSGPQSIGRHPMVLSGATVSIEIPSAGWTSNGEWGLSKGLQSSADAADFIFWPLSPPDNVFSDPCSKTLASHPPGQSAAELAAAVASIPGIHLVSGPSEVRVGGYTAQHVVFTLPNDIGCAPDHFYLWADKDNPGAERYATQLGETFSIWIIDVDGTIVWIDSETFVSSGAEAGQEVQQIVDSIHFEHSLGPG
jgi:hypothetical protein